MMNRYKYIDEKGEHLHTLDEKPLIGTSTACKVIAKPLVWWASGKAVEKLGWTNPKLTKKVERIEKAQECLDIIKGFDVDSYVKLLDSAYRAHAETLKESAQSGTDLHAELEEYVKGCIKKNGVPQTARNKSEKVQAFSKWARQNVKWFLWAEGNCYSEKLWVGGIADAGAIMKDGSVAVIDFKSGKDAYEDYFIQCAGYSIQIEENGIVDKDGNQTLKPFKIGSFYVIPFGAPDPFPRPRFNIEELQETFKATLALYKSLNK